MLFRSYGYPYIDTNNGGSLKGALSGRHLLPLNEHRDGLKGPGSADFSGTVDGFDIATIGRWLPLVTHEGLREWLTGALQGGTLRDARVRLRMAALQDAQATRNDP